MLTMLLIFQRDDDVFLSCLLLKTPSHSPLTVPRRLSYNFSIFMYVLWSCMYFVFTMFNIYIPILNFLFVRVTGVARCLCCITCTIFLTLSPSINCLYFTGSMVNEMQSHIYNLFLSSVETSLGMTPAEDCSSRVKFSWVSSAMKY